jgi:hypothetical protein
MNVFFNRALVFAMAAGAIGLANCSGKESIPAATSSPTPTVGATATATPTATPTATAAPTATPTAAAICPTPYPDPNSTTVPIVGNGQAQTVNVPCYADFTGVSTIPAGTTAPPGTYANIAVTNDANAFSVPTDPNAGTRLLTTSISVTQTVTLGNPSIATVVTSPSMINTGHTYEAELYLLLFKGGKPTAEPQDYQTNLVPTGHSISFNVTNPAGDTFSAGPVAYVIIYQN